MEYKYEIILKDGTMLIVTGKDEMVIAVFNHASDILRLRRIDDCPTLCEKDV